jgi:dephospho-CoA kinase
MIILGIVGRPGSGRGTVARYLKEWCAFPIVSLEDFVEDLAAEMDLAPTPSNLHDVYRLAFEREGREAFVNRAIQTIGERGWQMAIISGIQMPVEVSALREYYRDDFRLIHVRTSDSHERYVRLQKRDGDLVPRSYEAFLKEERAGEALFELKAAIEQADLEIENDGRLEDLHRAIEARVIQEELADEVVCG